MAQREGEHLKNINAMVQNKNKNEQCSLDQLWPLQSDNTV